MALASDLFRNLTDDLLCVILSYLPIKEAVRSSVFSRRWRYLYHRVSKLVLSPDLLIGQALPNPAAIAQVENIISNILFLHSSNLETFDLYNTNDWNFTPQNICKWVHCVASMNVKALSLRYFSDSSIYYADLTIQGKFYLLPFSYVIESAASHFTTALSLKFQQVLVDSTI